MVRFIEDGGGSDESAVAPVIPLFGGTEGVAARSARPATRPGWHPTWVDEPRESITTVAEAEADARDSADVEQAEKALLRKLRTRSLSVKEARAVAAERDLDEEAILSLLDEFLRRGYLDDAALAEQLVYSATTRKGQGRQAVAQTLAKRGIPRDVADAAIADMPDDEAERALEFARTKARSMGSLDFDTALRRLSGQLARRGYGGSVASNAAREALAEAGIGRSSVRFR